MAEKSLNRTGKSEDERMILLIDNYDSFSFNLYQLVGEIYDNIKVVRNDEVSLEEIREMKPFRIIISPGPGRPENAGIIIDVIREFGDKIPILGVCLGHQAICMAYGGSITYADKLMHGKQSVVDADLRSPMFRDCPEKMSVARYHSLALDESTLPKELKVSARTEDGVIMAVEHTEYPVYGLQFHPESILTPDGKTILENFVRNREVFKHDY